MNNSYAAHQSDTRHLPMSAPYTCHIERTLWAIDLQQASNIDCLSSSIRCPDRSIHKEWECILVSVELSWKYSTAWYGLSGARKELRLTGCVVAVVWRVDATPSWAPVRHGNRKPVVRFRLRCQKRVMWRINHLCAHLTFNV